MMIEASSLNHFLMMAEAAISLAGQFRVIVVGALPQSSAFTKILWAFSVSINNFLLKLAAQGLLAATKHPGQGNNRTNIASVLHI